MGRLRRKWDPEVRDLCVRAVERLGYGIWMPLFIPLSLITFLAAITLPHIASRRQRVGLLLRLWRRWAALMLKGFDPLREIWWAEFALEDIQHRLRYVMMIELFDCLNMLSPVRPELSRPRKFLFMKVDHFGDFLHAVPMMRALAQQSPESEIVILTADWCREVAERVPYARRIVYWNPRLHRVNRKMAAPTLSWWGEIRLLWRLRRERFDMLVTPGVTNFTEMVVLHAVLPKAWLGTEVEQRLYPDFCQALTVPYDGSTYEALRVGRMLTMLGLKPPKGHLEFLVTEEDRRFAREILERIGGGENARPIAICPGAGWPGKRWPVDRFVALAERLQRDVGGPILLLGGPDEANLAQRFNRNYVLNMIGQTSIGQAAALLERSRVYVGNDSGLLHIAAAVGTPTVAIFGPTRPERWAPPGGRHVVVRAHESCDGCWPWHPRGKCYHDYRCMKSIGVDEVLDAVCQLLEHESGSGRGCFD